MPKNLFNRHTYVNIKRNIVVKSEQMFAFFTHKIAKRGCKIGNLWHNGVAFREARGEWSVGTSVKALR